MAKTVLTLKSLHKLGDLEGAFDEQPRHGAEPYTGYRVRSQTNGGPELKWESIGRSQVRQSAPAAKHSGRCEKGRCRLGFDAPRDVLIGRAEAKPLRVEPEERSA